MSGPIPCTSKASSEPIAFFKLSEMLTRLYAKSDRGHLHDVTVEAVCLQDRIQYRVRQAYRAGAPVDGVVRYDFPAAVEYLACTSSRAPYLLEVLGYNGVHGTWRIAGSEDEWKEF